MKFLSIHFLSFEHSQEIHNNVYFTIPSSSSSSIVSSNYTKIVQDNRRIKKILSFAKEFLFTFVHYAKRDFDLFFISSKRTPSLFRGVCSDGSCEIFFFFYSRRVRVAKTRNFVKYRYFETVDPLKTSCTMVQNP